MWGIRAVRFGFFLGGLLAVVAGAGCNCDCFKNRQGDAPPNKSISPAGAVSVPNNGQVRGPATGQMAGQATGTTVGPAGYQPPNLTEDAWRRQTSGTPGGN
jgi:hypothetical protein